MGAWFWRQTAALSSSYPPTARISLLQTSPVSLSSACFRGPLCLPIRPLVRLHSILVLVQSLDGRQSSHCHTFSRANNTVSFAIDTASLIGEETGNVLGKRGITRTNSKRKVQPCQAILRSAHSKTPFSNHIELANPQRTDTAIQSLSAQKTSTLRRLSSSTRARLLLFNFFTRPILCAPARRVLACDHAVWLCLRRCFDTMTRWVLCSPNYRSSFDAKPRPSRCLEPLVIPHCRRRALSGPADRHHRHHHQPHTEHHH